MPRTQTARATATTGTAPASTTKIKKLRDARASADSGPDRLMVAGTDPATVTRINIRAGAMAHYAAHLARTTSKAGDRYSDKTIESYLLAVRSLDLYLTDEGFDGDFADVDAEVINAYLAHYRATHHQGGTNTKLRKLRPFFNWLAATYDVDNPFNSGKVAYYAPSRPAPAALGRSVVDDLLAVCRPEKGSPTEFEDTRDTAIIRFLQSGVRRGQIVGVHVEDVDWSRGTAQVIAQKGQKRDAAVMRTEGGQEYRAGQHVPLSTEATVALNRWLKIRAHHQRVAGRNGIRPRPGVGPMSGPLWFGTRGRGPMTGSGILKMIKRRAEEAGYDPATINAHAFRHTRAHFLQRAGVADGDIMAVMGWSDRSMLDRYGHNLANDRAIEAIRRIEA